MREYDLEALSKEVFERHARRVQREDSWDNLSDYIKGYFRSNIRETIECYERQLSETEARTKRESKKKDKGK